MGNNYNISYKKYNTYINLVSDLYKKPKKHLYRYKIMMSKKNINIYDFSTNNMENLNSPISSPINTNEKDKFTYIINLIENYINKENIGTPRNLLFKDITDIIYSDSDDDNFVIII
jgi:hypothetical protein